MNGAPPTTVPNAALYPWSQRRLNFPTPQSNPFPRYGAAVNAVASKEGDVYMMGGLVNGSMVKGDLWMVESGGGNLSCYPIATVSEGPGPRVGHSSLLVGNAFIVFGGDTKMDDSDTLDDTLYLLNTCMRYQTCFMECQLIVYSISTMVSRITSRATACRKIRSFSEHTWVQDLYLWRTS